MKCYDICTCFCPYYIIYITILLSLKFLGYSVDMSSNPMKMYLMCVSQHLCENWLLPQKENFPNDYHIVHLHE